MLLHFHTTVVVLLNAEECNHSLFQLEAFSRIFFDMTAFSNLSAVAAVEKKQEKQHNETQKLNKN